MPPLERSERLIKVLWSGAGVEAKEPNDAGPLVDPRLDPTGLPAIKGSKRHPEGGGHLRLSLSQVKAALPQVLAHCSGGVWIPFYLLFVRAEAM